jgi:uncharacterized protein (UPF0332 family)
MTGRDFLPLAIQLAAGNTEAEWRTAVSRAYYAAFHVARELFEDLGFRVPPMDRAHKHLVFRLSNCGEPQIQQVGFDLDSLRRLRNQADYDFQLVISQGVATARVQVAGRIIQTLDAIQDPVRTQITDAMKIYERDVLRDVTWHP